MNVITAVGYENESLRDKAQLLAKQLNLELDKDASSCLYVSTEKISLKMANFSLLSADFNSIFWQKRKAEGKKQGLVRACKPCRGLKIIDATAGWGRDAAVLASFGAEVLLLERNPVMATLLADALLHQDEEEQQKMKIFIKETDSLKFLTDLQFEEYPDVIYIDPMHPERTKSALVKKDMQALQKIIGFDNDALELIQIAIRRVKQRVVVKWPQKVAALLNADARIEGKTVRFDIYFAKR